ncbi:hypothetical protein [Streptomyces chiangmaiensis]|uniref:Uncharacterized protein n=1 Tax=Streptomyces chiangmaiensis TaxID=766497 RepID=A0ABU7FS35_9ACTN|nr:hypothetical protein [Streptomyces chiangmaiensis]MED7826920.1 hypothetical protein [Streptomyces chiangmaiensis]
MQLQRLVAAPVGVAVEVARRRYGDRLLCRCARLERSAALHARLAAGHERAQVVTLRAADFLAQRLVCGELVLLVLAAPLVALEHGAPLEHVVVDALALARTHRAEPPGHVLAAVASSGRLLQQVRHNKGDLVHGDMPFGRHEGRGGGRMPHTAGVSPGSCPTTRGPE